MPVCDVHNEPVRRTTLPRTGAAIAAGLVLTLGALASDEAKETPAWPNPPPDHWVTYHLAHPGPGNAHPGDPNAAFDYKGRYHLHYIYRTDNAFAHVSSEDMVRWKWHPTVLAPSAVGHGMYSGTGFYTKEGRPAIIYHAQGAGRNVIQYAVDDVFDSWSKPVPVIARTADGKPAGSFRQWDPDCWLMNDTYYAYSGGQNPQLMKSADLVNWIHLGDLLHPEYPADLGVPKGEDISCGNMFKIGHKWMLLCISHSLGARYYLGDFKDEKYLPYFHARMSFEQHFFFAPESLLTRDGRRVMWAWLMDRMPIQPKGVQSLPRELDLPPDGVLRIRPLRELATLRYDPKGREGMTVKDGERIALDEASGDALELELTLAAPLPTEVGLSLLGDKQGQGGMSIVFGAGRNTLRVGPSEPPFKLWDGEDLTLRVFIDKNLVEVFANDRQAAVYAVKTPQPVPNLSLYAKDGDATVRSFKTWRMRSIYNSEPAK